MYKILVPTDFSDNANKALRYAVNLYGTDAKYTLVNGYEVPHSGANMLISIADILEKDALQLLHESRDKLLEVYPDLKGNVDVRTKMGMPSVAVKKITDTEDFDLIVMGTKGATGLKEVFIGSVASNILSEVTIPVLAVPEETVVDKPKKILFAADDQCLSEGVLPEALVKLSNEVDAEVLVVNVVESGELKYVGNSADQKHRSDGIFEGVKHSVHFVEAETVNEGILAFISETPIDMIAMIMRKQDLVSKLFGRSDTETMMMHTDIPLFAFH